MDIVMRILGGAFAVAVGLFFLFKSEMMLDFLGTFDSIDSRLGPNGTRLFYKLLGTIVVIIGFLVMTNLWDAFLGATLGSLLPKPRI